MKNQIIGIVGGTGFIGQNLTNYFVEIGFNVVVASRNIDKSKILDEKITAVAVAVENSEKLHENLKHCDTVIWLVSSLIPSTSNDSLIYDFSTNVRPIIRFLELLKIDSNVKRFVYLSSGGTIYGDSVENKPFSEENPKNPISGYGLSKIVTEDYIKFLTTSSQFQSFILRPSNVYGQFQNLVKPQGIIGFAFTSILNGATIDLYDEGKVTRDFIHVSDLANAIHCCLISDYKASKTIIYNVGSQKGYTIKQILDKIDGITKKHIVTIPKSSRSFDCNYNVLNIEKIKNEMNWEPKIEIQEGLELVWDWIKNTENAK